MIEAANTGSYSFELTSQAECAKVWEALTEGIDAWWLPDFRMFPTSKVSLRPQPDGQLLETGGDGSHLVWYSVQYAVAGQELHLVGHIGKSWGGPALSMLSIKLVAQEGSTLIQVSDALLGAVSPKQLESLEAGWRRLFEALAAYAAA